ncbi:LuxR family transcriptional regulator [Thermopolyspora sp. NPDC052614]|uniref:helix-turn-helix transcriptional regulator n=1 Tax=Thermopolyspora sp. NPDC052614 TaxID=3155682 RepID=UPI003426AD67
MTTLIERDAELHVLASMLKEADRGNGGVVAVTGPVGAGKTALIEEFMDRAGRAGALVMNATAARTEEELPFEVIAQLFQHVVLRPDCWELVQQQIDPRLCEALFTAESTGQDAERAYSQIVRTLWLLLVHLSRDRPVVLVADDVQHADELSAQAMLFLARRLRRSRMLMVLTEQSSPRHQYRPLHSELLSLPRYRRIRLAPLTPGGIRDGLHAAFPDGPPSWAMATGPLRLAEPARTDPQGEDQHARGAPADEWRALAKHWYALTGGSPLLVSALIEEYRARRAGRPARGNGGAFAEAVLACLHRSTVPVLRTAQAIALLDDATTPCRAGELAGLDVSSVSEHIAALNATGLLTGHRFRAEAARLAVINHTEPGERARLHTRAATELHRAAAGQDQVVGHLLKAAPPLPRWAVTVLRQAAVQSLKAGLAERAVSCLELARSTADEDERTPITAMLARTELRNDPALPMRHVPELTAAVKAGRLTRTDACFLLRYLAWHGRFDEAAQVLDEMERLPGDRTEEERFLRAWLAYYFPLLAVRVPEPPDRSAPAVPENGPYTLAADTLIALLAGHADVIETDTVERTLATCRLDDVTFGPLTAMLTGLLNAGKADAAARGCDILIEQADAQRAHTWQAILAGHRAEIAVRQGALETAREYAVTALTLLDMERWGIAVGVPLAAMLRASVAAGDLAEAARLAAMPVPPALFRTRYGLDYWRARGRYHLAAGHTADADADFRACRDLLAVWEAAARECTATSAGGGHPDAVADEWPDKTPDADPPSARILDGPFRPLPDGPGRLSRSEWRVIRLAVRGLTNREIARELHITVSTVEQHLTHVYRKLKVTRRTQLHGRLTDLGLTDLAFTGARTA